MALYWKSPHVMDENSLEGLPPHDHGGNHLFINNPHSDTTGGGHHPELPIKGVQEWSAISVFQLALVGPSLF
jgi:hypothetical protein